jgi:acyl-[acyl-carrier-protein]-phospholipid O-acyltransferase/long-chain-fatty-acid--[acyl-carrier-protein] ligase
MNPLSNGLTATDSVFAPEVPMPPLPPHWRSLPRAFISRARARRTQPAVADSTGESLTSGELLVRALALGRVLGRILGPEPNLGVYLPPSVAAVLANLAVVLLGRRPVNLNYTAGRERVDSAVRTAGIAQILTARKAVEKFGAPPQAELVFLEDLPPHVTARDRVFAAVAARVVPLLALGLLLPGLGRESLEGTAAILFTSGATGDPKGVVLSHRNLLSNVRQIEAHLEPLPGETVLGVLPFFHAMGFTVTLWAVLCLGRRAVYHTNPLDARTIGELCRDHRITLLFLTPTFLRTYLRRGDRGMFATVRRIGLGAEKLKPELGREIREVLEAELLEGYGTTETAPVVAFKVDRDLVTRDGRVVSGNRPGSVGRPLPGTAIKTIDPDTEADLPWGSEGIVCVKGPQVMVGYLNGPEATARVLRDGWYVTDDIGRVDEEGFLHITGRVSRFSKIGGELVPHERVELAVRAAAGVDEPAVAVTAVADLARGERLAVVYVDLGGKSPVEVVRAMTDAGLPRLWVPAPADFLRVESLPLLGTGKIDLRQLRRLAGEQLGG